MIENTYYFLAKGGIVMIPILLASFIGLVLFFERFFALKMKKVLPGDLRQSLREAIDEKQWERALSLCDSKDCGYTRLCRSALKKRRCSREIIQQTLADEAKHVIDNLERFLPSIGAVATVAPLLGLLGTVTGMISIFSKVGTFSGDATMSTSMLANGIWEALLTTAAGLTVAIPIFLLHHLLENKVRKIIHELEIAASEILDALAPPEIVRGDT